MSEEEEIKIDKSNVDFTKIQICLAQLYHLHEISRIAFKEKNNLKLYDCIEHTQKMYTEISHLIPETTQEEMDAIEKTVTDNLVKANLIQLEKE